MKLNPFKRDYPAELDKTKAELVTARNRLAELQQQRTAALGEAAAPIGDLRKIDRATEEGRATVVLLEDRVRRLHTLARQAALTDREAARSAAIKNTIKPALAECQKFAAQIDRAAIAFSETYAAFEAATKHLTENWPAAVPKPSYWSGAMSIISIRRRIESAMEYGNIRRLAEFMRVGSEESIAEIVRRQAETTITELEAVEIVLPAEPLVDVHVDEPATPESARGFAALATSGAA